jgi:hypothetical protein
VIFAFIDFISELFVRKKCGANLLSDSSRLSFLNVGFSDLVEEGCFTCIHMTQNAAYWTSVVPFSSGKVQPIIFEHLRLLGLFFFSFPFVFVERMLQLFFGDIFVILFVLFVDHILIELQLFPSSLQLLCGHTLLV